MFWVLPINKVPQFEHLRLLLETLFSFSKMNLDAVKASYSYSFSCCRVQAYFYADSVFHLFLVVGFKPEVL